MKKWSNPKLKNLSVESTSDTMPRTHIPVCGREDYNPFDRETCFYYSNGCTHGKYGNSNIFNGPILWPCQKAAEVPTPTPAS